MAHLVPLKFAHKIHLLSPSIHIYYSSMVYGWRGFVLVSSNIYVSLYFVSCSQGSRNSMVFGVGRKILLQTMSSVVVPAIVAKVEGGGDLVSVKYLYLLLCSIASRC